MKRFLFTASLAATIIVTPFLTNAEEIQGVSPEEFVREYVEASKVKNYERLADMAIDDRFQNDRQAEIDSYKMIDETTPSLVNYKIKKVNEVKENKAVVITVLEYDDGSIEQTPMHLIKQDGGWKVHIKLEDAKKDKDFKELKSPEMNVAEQEALQEYSNKARAASLGRFFTSYSYSGMKGGATFYSSDTFSTGLEPGFAILLTQTHNYTSKDLVRVNYAIVRTRLLASDVEWGDATKTGDYPATPFEGRIYGGPDAYTMTSAKLRFRTNPGSVSSMGYRGSVSLYSYRYTN